MATQPKAGAITLADWAKTRNPDGSTAAVIELLSQSNEIILDMKFKEGNLPTGHRTTVRTGIPVPTWRKLYKGVPPSKSTRAQVDDTCGMLEARNEVDVDLVDLNGDAAAFRLSEAQAEVEGMNQALALALFYGDQSVNPERITGFAPRYSSIVAQSGANILDAGGSGSDNTSIWLVVWGDNTVHGIVPKGSKAGLEHKDLGEIDAFDENQNRYRALADLWKWKCGLTVRDWRYVVRIANIDVSDLAGQTGTQAATAATTIIKMMTRAFFRIPQMGMGTATFYANRTVKEFLAVAAQDKNNSVLTVEAATNQFGTVSPGSANNGTLKFLGVPIRTVDQLLNTEARVV
jgi:hypothetical protein